MPIRFGKLGQAVVFGCIATAGLQDGLVNAQGISASSTSPNVKEEGSLPPIIRRETAQPQMNFSTATVGSESGVFAGGDLAAIGYQAVPNVVPVAYNPNSYYGAGNNSHACINPIESKNCCDLPWWAHRSSVFADFLYLYPGNTDIIYAREESDPGLSGSPIGPLGLVNIDGSPGYRVGVQLALDDCSSFVTSYTRWDGSSSHSITASGTNILNPVLLHPSTLTTGSTGVQASASQSISFQFADAAYRRVFRHGQRYVINWTGGLRYGNLEQNFGSDQVVSVATGLTKLRTDIDFDGFGFLGGLDAERQSCETGLLIYGKGAASFLGGDWKADVTQRNQFGGGTIGNSLTDFRITPILEAELGCGWQSASGRLRLTSGLLASGWFNAISTRDYLQSFNEANFVDMNDTISFAGWVSRVELRR